MATVLEKKSIAMVVDADPETEAKAKSELEAQGYEVVTYSDGTRALNAIEAKYLKHPPALIFIDVILPKMSGFETTRRLLEKLKSNKTCVFLMSKHKAQEDEMEAYSLGVGALLPKPLTWEAVKDALAKIQEKENRNQAAAKNFGINYL